MSEKTSLVNTYLKLTEEYQKIYGSKTVVWMQTGSFYEVYDWKDDSTQIITSRDILGIRVTRRANDKAYMAGFPYHSYSRFERKMLLQQYTIVYVNQVSKDPIKREVVLIKSPGCACESLESIESLSDSSMSMDDNESILCSVLLEFDDNMWYPSYASFDVNRGEIRMITIDPIDKISEVFEGIRDFLIKTGCHELLLYIISEEKIEIPIFQENVLKHITYKDPVVIRKEHMDMQIYQPEMLRRYFTKYETSYEDIIDSLDIREAEAGDIGNLLLMLDFIKSHDKEIIVNISRPILNSDFRNNEKTIRTFNQTFQKLQIISNDTKNLFNLVDKTLTRGGSKKLYTLLTNPSYDSIILKDRYNAVDQFLTFRQLLSITKEHLKLTDLVRLYRRFAIGRINACNDIPKIHDMNRRICLLFTKFRETLSTIDNDVEMGLPHWFPTKEECDLYDLYTNEVERVFDLKNCSEGSGNVFSDGISIEIEDLYEAKRLNFDELQIECTRLSNQIGEPVYLRHNEKDGYFYELTKKRLVKLQQLLDISSYSINIVNTQAKLSSKDTRRISQTLFDLNPKIELLTKLKVAEITKGFYDKYYDNTISRIIEALSWMDVYYSYASNALEWNHIRPVIIDQDDSCVKVIGLRHPLIEKIMMDKKEKYVSNSMILDPCNNYLIYGVNSVGKSSFLKSIGISVIMAQAGMFVAADEFHFTPYNKICVRIGNSDNLFESHSSFICELREANQCVKHADNNTLILADEFCSSTERESATTIVTSMLEWLNKKRASYIFATHLFELLETTTNITDMKIVHLKVHIEDSKMIFDRILTVGPPTERNYGVLVAGKVFQDIDFLNLLSENSENSKISKNLELEKSKNKPIHKSPKSHRSRYNSKLVVTNCAICGYIPENERSIPLDTHHINMQCLANKDGFIGSSHKHALHNLVVLCKECHVNVHQGNLVISGWIQADSGLFLKYNENVTIPKESIDLASLTHLNLTDVKDLTDLKDLEDLKDLTDSDSSTIDLTTVKNKTKKNKTTKIREIRSKYFESLNV
jgi:DNA mismatch repair protein MutS